MYYGLLNHRQIIPDFSNKTQFPEFGCVYSDSRQAPTILHVVIGKKEEAQTTGIKLFETRGNLPLGFLTAEIDSQGNAYRKLNTPGIL